MGQFPAVFSARRYRAWTYGQTGRRKDDPKQIYNFGKKLLYFNKYTYICDMRENENSTIGDLMIWVTVLGAGTFALEGLCVHFIGKDWLKIVFFLLGAIVLIRESVVEWRKPGKSARSAKSGQVDDRLGQADSQSGRAVGKLTWAEATKVCSMALTVFPIVFMPGSNTSPLGKALLLIAFFPLMVYGLYRSRRKEEAEARKEEEQLRAPMVLRDQVARSGRKVFIVCSHAREVDLHFEVDDRMFLYSLPDGRFLVLFRKDVPLESFLGTLADFRTEVDADEDAIGCYGLPHDGPRPDLPLVFVCNKDMESRPFEFDPSTVPISAAVPV